MVTGSEFLDAVGDGVRMTAENKRRVLACVNLLRGIPTELIESALKVMAADDFQDNAVSPELFGVLQRSFNAKN